jgi:hypothetical protein
MLAEVNFLQSVVYSFLVFLSLSVFGQQVSELDTRGFVMLSIPGWVKWHAPASSSSAKKAMSMRYSNADAATSSSSSGTDKEYVVRFCIPVDKLLNLWPV